MAASLLAHLYTHIKGSQEDIATISLQYILSQSEALCAAFTRRISSHLCIDLDESLYYTTQVVGKNKERPDLSGFDSLGHEQVLCEMKFYAGLTPNQPLAYIDRLAEESGKGLLFICPSARLLSLWTQLRTACADRTVNQISDYSISVDGIHMAIISWSEILELLTITAASVAVELLADIKQLEGYCAQLDSDAFIPFVSEELTADNAKKAERYYAAIDETINLLCDDDAHETSLKGLKATAYRHGYTRSLFIDDITISLNYDRNLWKSSESIETPFWVAIRDSDWSQSDDWVDRINQYPHQMIETNLWSLYFLALIPPTNATLQEVAQSLKLQILSYIDVIAEKA